MAKRKKLINDKEEELWNRARKIDTKESYQYYLTYFRLYPQYMKHKRDAQDRINAFNQGEAKLRADREAFKKAERINTVASYKQYLMDFSSGRYVNQAEEAILRLSEMVVEKLVEEAGHLVVRFDNVLNLRYKDLSPDLGLEVDDSKLRSENILDIRYENQGTFKLLVRDDWEKEQLFSFSNRLTANMGHSPDSTQVIFTINGGKKPYSVDLISYANNEVAWSMGGIRDFRTSISKDSLLAKGLQGTYRAEVWDGDQLRPVFVEGNLELVPPPRQGIDPIFLFTAIVMIMALMFLVILFWWNRKKNREAQIYTHPPNRISMKRAFITVLYFLLFSGIPGQVVSAQAPSKSVAFYYKEAPVTGNLNVAVEVHGSNKKPEYSFTNGRYNFNFKESPVGKKLVINLYNLRWDANPADPQAKAELVIKKEWLEKITPAGLGSMKQRMVCLGNTPGVMEFVH